MKKYLIFISSFIVLYFSYQYLSGMILTIQYDPETGGAGSGPSHLLILVVMATISYFLSCLPKRKQA
ncbi:hypothetical protein JF544_03180 [Halobacillus kuroshimensis]|uniref:Uncharacterized protein n=1 Tax=Halobacillus kuroshimensis TaxID=302481 RepID=A0ABS3DSA2_9BACI|nr:hypothetical protein [Halobacillus kuroshimensis]MBN8234230.1 hypothetical protein [Halobacillus kuroshimensis]